MELGSWGQRGTVQDKQSSIAERIVDFVRQRRNVVALTHSVQRDEDRA